MCKLVRQEKIPFLTQEKVRHNKIGFSRLKVRFTRSLCGIGLSCFSLFFHVHSDPLATPMREYHRLISLYVAVNLKPHTAQHTENEEDDDLIRSYFNHDREYFLVYDTYLFMFKTNSSFNLLLLTKLALATS